MYIFIFAIIILILVHSVIKKIKNQKQQEYKNSEVSYCETSDDSKHKSRHNSITGFCIFVSIFWLVGVLVLCQYLGHKKSNFFMLYF